MNEHRPAPADEDTWECGEPGCKRWSRDPIGEGWRVPAPGRGPQDEALFRCREHYIQACMEADGDMSASMDDQAAWLDQSECCGDTGYVSEPYAAEPGGGMTNECGEGCSPWDKTRARVPRAGDPS